MQCFLVAVKVPCLDDLINLWWEKIAKWTSIPNGLPDLRGRDLKKGSLDKLHFGRDPRNAHLQIFEFDLSVGATNDR